MQMPDDSNTAVRHDQTTEYELLSRSPSPLPPDITMPKDPKPFSQPWTTLAVKTWLWEILAIIFSVICFIAIVCILIVFDGNPRPAFAYGFTLNAIISIIATASKSSLIYVIGECIGQLKWIWFHKADKKKELGDMQLFDSASRGPLGSLSVILQHKGRSLVSLGALLTVLALMFDPFMQQILKYPTRQTIRDGDSSGAVAKQAHFFFPKPASIDFQGVVNTGIWSESPAQLEPAVSCSSGNCAWEPFQSVGVCSQCEDITSRTRLECGSMVVNDTATIETTATDCEVIPPQGERASIRINSTISPIQSLSDGIYYPSLFLDVPGQKVWFPFQRNESEEQNGSDATYSGVKSPQFVIAHAELALESNITTGLSPLVHLGNTFRLSKVTQCVLALCVRTYRISVSNGTANFDISAPADFGQIFSTPDLFFSGPDCWKPSAQSHGGSPESVNLAELPAGYADISKMAFCPITTYDLGKYLEGESVMPYMAFNLSTWISDSVAEGGRLLPENPAAGKVVGDGLESVVGAVAASLTKAAISASNYTVVGTVYTSEVYIDVDWIWLLLPAALITFGTLFLELTVLTNRRQRLHPWKSSMLAVLFHGLSNMETESMMNGRSTVGQMEKTAQNIHVRLRTVDQRRGLMLDQS